MSLGEIIKYCPECHTNILTTKQNEEKKPCIFCQKDHAKTLKERLEKVNEINEFNS